MRINALNEKSGSAGALFLSSSPVRTAWRWWLLALFIASFDLLSKAVTQAVMPHLSAMTMTSFFNCGIGATLALRSVFLPMQAADSATFLSRSRVLFRRGWCMR